jgi:RNA polymerase sigma-70 factor (ECF subfamily)
MVNNASDADDLTIEAFGKAFRNLDSYTPKFAFSTWLFKIATNNCVDFIRKKQLLPTPLDNLQDSMESATINLQSDLPDPEESLIIHQKITALKDIVSQLKPRYKTLIELRYFKEYSYEEISSELNLPIGTVKAQLFRAKTLLYNVLIKTGHR